MDNEALEREGVSTHHGFPNAASDTSLSSLDLGKLLVRQPSSTFFMRVRGAAGEHESIYDGDIVVVDRSLVPRAVDRVIWWQDDSFMVGAASRIPARTAPWGVVTYVIHELRRQA